MSAERARPRAVILGLAGPSPDGWEVGFLRDADPLGFILFGRNLADRDGIVGLTRRLREIVGDPAAPILIDQEGGRVARLAPPRWPAFPSARELAQGPPAATRANARAIGGLLAGLGIDTNCAPVADVHVPGVTHGIIGARAFSDDPAVVATHARAYAEGLRDAGILPVVKHIPGHGRGAADSHLELPATDADDRGVEAFAALADLPVAMTAHMLYRDWDPDAPATLSARVIGGIIRGRIGFGGLLLTDDLSMAALSGTLAERTRRAFGAGADIALHCNGDRAEMEEVAAAAPAMSDAAAGRWARALAWRNAG